MSNPTNVERHLYSTHHDDQGRQVDAQHIPPLADKARNATEAPFFAAIEGARTEANGWAKDKGGHASTMLHAAKARYDAAVAELQRHRDGLPSREEIAARQEAENAKLVQEALVANAAKRKAVRAPLVAELAHANEALTVATEKRRERYEQPSGILIRTDDLDAQIAKLRRRSDVIAAELQKLDREAPVTSTTREQLGAWW